MPTNVNTRCAGCPRKSLVNYPWCARCRARHTLSGQSGAVPPHPGQAARVGMYAELAAARLPLFEGLRPRRR